MDEIREGLPLTLTHLQRLKLQAWVMYDETLKNAWKNNCTDYFIEEIGHKTGVSKENHIVIFVYGEQGLGKSKLIQKIMKIIDPDVTVDNIMFGSQDVLDVLPLIKRGSVVCRDETYQEFGVGSNRIREGFNKAIETLRKSGISFIMARPEYEMINGVHWILRVLARNDVERKTWCALLDPKTMFCMGGIILHIDDDSDDLWVKYLEKKDAFINQVKNQTNAKYNISEKAEEVLNALLEQDPNLTLWVKKLERKNFVKEFNSGFTSGENDAIHIEMERLIRVRKLNPEFKKPTCPDCVSTFIRYLSREDVMMCGACGLKWKKKKNEEINDVEKNENFNECVDLVKRNKIEEDIDKLKDKILAVSCKFDCLQ